MLELGSSRQVLKIIFRGTDCKITGNLARKRIQILGLQKYLSHLITTTIFVEAGCLNKFKDMAIKLQEQIKYCSP